MDNDGKKISEIRGKTVLIVGYGREGKSVAQWLKKHHPELTVAIVDKKDGEHYLRTIDQYDTVIRSPGVAPFGLHTQGHLTSATNIFFSLCPGTIIGVTGTKGKSTTSSLIAHILASVYPDVRLVGNIGIPMLDHLEDATENTVFVIELSSHQLVDIHYSPHIAVLLNIVPEHLDYYPDFETYKVAKANLVKFQKANDMVVYHPAVRDVAEMSSGKKIPFEQGVSVKSTLLGNKENIVAAVTVAHALGVTNAVIDLAIATFSALPHRLEYVGTYKDIQFYNDSLSTIPEAAVHALEALGTPVATLIAGGFDRHLDFAVLGNYLGKHPVATLILFPDTGEKIWRAIPPRARQQIQRFDVISMEETVTLAYAHTPKGKICLLSPASSSYNLFRDYADRGEQFKEWVMRLGR